MGRKVKERFSKRMLRKQHPAAEQKQQSEEQAKEKRVAENAIHGLPPGRYALNYVSDARRPMGRIEWAEREKEREPFEGELRGQSEFERQQEEQRSLALRKPISLDDSIPVFIQKCRLQDFIKHEYDSPESFEIEHLMPSRRRRRRD